MARHSATESFSNSIIGHEAFKKLVMDITMDKEVCLIRTVYQFQEPRKLLYLNYYFLYCSFSLTFYPQIVISLWLQSSL